jgi:hypothetical protein
MPIVSKELQPGEMPNTVASPVSTYERPSAGGAAEILGALKSFIPQVQQASVNYDQQKGDEEEAQARRMALTATPEDLRKEIASGNYFGLSHKRATVALQVMDGTNRAFDATQQLAAMEKRGELAGADIASTLQSVIGPHSDALTDPVAVKQFTKAMAPAVQQFKAGVQSANIAKDIATREAELYRYGIGVHDQIASEGGDEATHRRELYKAADYAKQNFLFSNSQVEKVYGQMAQHYAATGNTTALNVLGEFDRNGGRLKDKWGAQWDAYVKQAEAKRDSDRKDNANVEADSLAAEAMQGSGKPDDFYKRVDAARDKDPTYFGEQRAEQIKATFDRTVATKTKAAATSLAKQQEDQAGREYIGIGAEALLNGNGYAIDPQVRFKAADGVDRTYTFKDYQKQMFERAETLIDDRAKQEGWAPIQAELAKTRLYGANGEVRPVFQRSFDSLYAASSAGVAPDGVKLQERLQQLEFLRTQDPNQYAGLAGSGNDGRKQQTWLTSYRAAREFGLEPIEAYDRANQRVFNPGAVERYTQGQLAEKVDEVAKQFASTGFLGMGGIGAYSNYLTRKKASDAVDLMIASGVADKDIASKASEELQRNHVIVNGVPVRAAIPGVGDLKARTEYIEDAAKFYAETNPVLKERGIQVAITNDLANEDRYIAVDAKTGTKLSQRGITGMQLREAVMDYRKKLYLRAVEKRQQDLRDIAAEIGNEKVSTD